MAVDKYLRDQAIRMRRTKWPNPWILADELYLILRGIEVEETGPISITPPGGDPVDFPGVDDLNIPPFDLDFPEDGFPEPEVDQSDDGKRTTEEKFFWHRAIFPGMITSHEGGVFYTATLSPNGELVTQSGGTFGFNRPDTPASKEVTARLTDESLAGSVSLNTHLYVYWVAEFLVTEETIRNDDGRVLQKSTDIQVIQEEYLFNAPASGGGGKVARVTSTIEARDGTTPGKGRARLYSFGLPTTDPLTGEETPASLTEGEEVDVYNMVTSEIAAGSDAFIQVKRIDNGWFVDVEDCGG